MMAALGVGSPPMLTRPRSCQAVGIQCASRKNRVQDLTPLGGARSPAFLGWRTHGMRNERTARKGRTGSTQPEKKGSTNDGERAIDEEEVLSEQDREGVRQRRRTEDSPPPEQRNRRSPRSARGDQRAGEPAEEHQGNEHGEPHAVARSVGSGQAACQEKVTVSRPMSSSQCRRGGRRGHSRQKSGADEEQGDDGGHGERGGTEKGSAGMGHHTALTRRGGVGGGMFWTRFPPRTRAARSHAPSSHRAPVAVRARRADDQQGSGGYQRTAGGMRSQGSPPDTSVSPAAEDQRRQRVPFPSREQAMPREPGRMRWCVHLQKPDGDPVPGAGSTARAPGSESTPVRTEERPTGRHPARGLPRPAPVSQDPRCRARSSPAVALSGRRGHGREETFGPAAHRRKEEQRWSDSSPRGGGRTGPLARAERWDTQRARRGSGFPDGDS